MVNGIVSVLVVFIILGVGFFFTKKQKPRKRSKINASETFYITGDERIELRHKFFNPLILLAFCLFVLITIDYF